MDSFTFDWDDSPGSNVEHIADSDVRQDEFEEALIFGFERREPSRRGAESLITFGYTAGNRLLALVFLAERVPELEGWLIRPITAFDPETLPQKHGHA
jgi:hypothetical protein